MELTESCAVDWFSISCSSLKYNQMSTYAAEMKPGQSPLKLLSCFWISHGDTAFICFSQKEEVFLFHPCTFFYGVLDFLFLCFNFVYLAAMREYLLLHSLHVNLYPILKV